MSRIAYVNGRYQPLRQAMVHVEDRGFQFSDGVYEVCEVRGGRIVDARRCESRRAGHFVSGDEGDRDAVLRFLFRRQAVVLGNPRQCRLQRDLRQRRILGQSDQHIAALGGR